MEDRESRWSWQTVNEVSGSKSTSRVKLKAANRGERITEVERRF